MAGPRRWSNGGDNDAAVHPAGDIYSTADDPTTEYDSPPTTSSTPPPGNTQALNQALQAFLNESFLQIESIAPTAIAAHGTIVAIRDGNSSEAFQCMYFSGAYISSSDVVTPVYLIPSGQASNCYDQFLANRETSTMAWGAIMTGTKWNSATYSGAVGFGVVTVSPYYLGGCFAEAAGFQTTSNGVYEAGATVGAGCAYIPLAVTYVTVY